MRDFIEIQNDRIYDTALYIVDFGVLTMTECGPSPQPGTGVIWKITKI
jgi:hypothetical protein